MKKIIPTIVLILAGIGTSAAAQVPAAPAATESPRPQVTYNLPALTSNSLGLLSNPWGLMHYAGRLTTALKRWEQALSKSAATAARPAGEFQAHATGLMVTTLRFGIFLMLAVLAGLLLVNLTFTIIVAGLAVGALPLLVRKEVRERVRREALALKATLARIMAWWITMAALLVPFSVYQIHLEQAIQTQVAHSIAAAGLPAPENAFQTITVEPSIAVFAFAVLGTMFLALAILLYAPSAAARNLSSRQP